MTLVNRINVYTCETCNGKTVTIYRHNGTTPFVIGCRMAHCNGKAYSALYQVLPPVPEPAWEWYRPNLWRRLWLKRSASEHVNKGGLLLRRIKTVDFCENCENAPGEYTTEDDVFLCRECYIACLDDTVRS